MRNKNIHNLIIEGPDGVGKTTLIHNLFKHYNYRYMCYHRGEISNKLFAEKYKRPYYVTQNLLPFLYIVLLCDEYELRNRIRNRDDYSSEEELNEELKKVSDNKRFKELAEEMKNDYDIVVIDTTNLTEREVLNEVVNYLDNNINNEKDETITTWNEMYDIACKKYGLDFKVIENQPYINNVPINVESTLHNGVYETFTDKRYPDNLLYSLAYNQDKFKFSKKEYDFTYVINSKIKRRSEIYDYYNAFIKNNKTCLIADNDLIPKNDLLFRLPRTFKEEFINEISKAKATVYCARDLEALKLQTARLYESIMAYNIVFVDKESDKNCDILSQIYIDKYIIDLLYVTPETICKNYEIIINDDKLYRDILHSQNVFYNKLIREFEEGIKKHELFK